MSNTDTYVQYSIRIGPQFLSGLHYAVCSPTERKRLLWVELMGRWKQTEPGKQQGEERRHEVGEGRHQAHKVWSTLNMWGGEGGGKGSKWGAQFEWVSHSPRSPLKMARRTNSAILKRSKSCLVSKALLYTIAYITSIHYQRSRTWNTNLRMTNDKTHTKTHQMWCIHYRKQCIVKWSLITYRIHFFNPY